MTPEDKALWAAALRSGKYQQGRGKLRSRDNRFCCLGVACDVFQPEGWTETYSSSGCSVWGNNGSYGMLPESLQTRLGLDEKGVLPNGQALYELNDHYRLSFNQIADIIERLL